ncbi:diguanylate cyclase [Sphingomonas sp.]|uniref:GGDEF domain-containing protein n=1 Tax=Sphingomonas sp. TaxID=28214 RepID=UPI000DB8EDF3|nr:GGDEF domain-containing protein [Sphingomonas sp.]PZU09766.1 MAG: hypothetical protein DI605_09015 [Sphingomonas sp.]
MPTLPDLATLRLCSMLASFAFAVMYVAFWASGRHRSYLLYWAASAALYVFVLEAFEWVDGRAAFLRSITFGLLACTDILILIGAHSFHRRAPYRPGEIALLAGVILLPMIASTRAIGALLPAGFGFDLAMSGLAASKIVVGCWMALEKGEHVSLPQRLAGVTLLAYVPVYAIAIAAGHLGLGDLHLAAILPMIADQLLLAALNIALMAMPAERATRELREKALRDPLTGARNRAWLENYKAGAMSGEAAVILVDIDHFKRINDRYGHAAGDEVLTNFATRANEVLKAEHGMLARLGGDEFIAIVPDADAARAARIAEDLLDSLRVWTPGVPMATASLGVAVADAGDDLSGVMARADRHLYHAKAAGRDRVSVD